LFSFFGFRSSVGWMCALRTASPDWHSFARWSWSEATAPSNKLTGGRRIHSAKFPYFTNLHFVSKSSNSPHKFSRPVE